MNFSVAFLIGSVLAAILVILVLAPITAILGATSQTVRYALFFGAAASLAMLDWAGRTPYLRRQVPQRFYLQGMAPGWLGLLYGADMGLHVTTQKTSSLVWVVLLGSVLSGDTSVVVVVALVLALVLSAVILALALSEQNRWLSDLELHSGGVPWMTFARALGGLAGVILAAGELIRAASW